VTVTFPLSSAGATLDDVIAAVNELRAAAPVVRHASKATDESVPSSTVLQDDDDLSVPIAAGETLDVEFVLTFNTGDPASDAKFNVAIPAGASIKGIALHLDSPAAGATSLRLSPITSGGDEHVAGLGATFLSPVRIRVRVAAGATAGDVKLRYAQSTSSATPATLMAGSFMRAEVV
jgi:hypothetical protein